MLPPLRSFLHVQLKATSGGSLLDHFFSEDFIFYIKSRSSDSTASKAPLEAIETPSHINTPISNNIPASIAHSSVFLLKCWKRCCRGRPCRSHRNLQENAVENCSWRYRALISSVSDSMAYFALISTFVVFIHFTKLLGMRVLTDILRFMSPHNLHLDISLIPTSWETPSFMLR